MNNKKKYEAPEMKVYQVQKANVIATSSIQSTLNEEYGTETPDWY